MFLKKMEKSKRLKKQNVTVRHINTIYSLCWIFQLRILLRAGKKAERYAGYYAGFDESVMTAGKIALLPSFEEQEVEDECVIADRVSEEEALEKCWEYNKTGIFRKFRNLYAPPELTEYVVDRVYKPMYVMEFTNHDLDEKKYRVLDSLTGDLEKINLV